MKWFKIEFGDVFLNGLTTAEVGCVVKYKCMCQQCETDTLSLAKLRSIFNSRELKFVQNYFGLCSENAEVCSKNAEVCSKNAEVCSEKESKNKDLSEKSSRAYNIYNIDNNIKEKTEETDKTDKNSGEPPNKQYAFEGKIIKLKQKDFDAWKLAYPDLNLRAELLQRDIWLQAQPPEEQKKWFLSTSQFFIKQNERRKAQNADIAEQYGTANKPENDNVCWF
jgi:hypothetical protein